MYSKIKRLRHQGARKSDRDIQADPGHVGHVTMCIVGIYREMKLHGAGDDSQRKATLPLLINPVIVAMTGTRMLFEGWERQGDQDDPRSPAVMQEWAIEILQPVPAEIAERSHRPL